MVSARLFSGPAVSGGNTNANQFAAGSAALDVDGKSKVLALDDAGKSKALALDDAGDVDCACTCPPERP